MAQREREGQASESLFNAPFRDLKRLVREVSPSRAALSEAAPTRREEQPKRGRLAPQSLAPVEDKAALFRAAVAGAVPIDPEQRSNVAGELRPVAPLPPGLRENAAALAELNDLVSGNTAFDVSDTDEHVEGMVVGLNPRVLRKLRMGEFAYQSHLDLHGLTAVEAKAAVRQFLLRAVRSGHRCVLVIHGRGRNSPDQQPVLKDGLKSWLSRGELAHFVLAFSTARACDGGAGAMYVLLRRERRQKKPFRTFEGTKSMR